MNKMTRRDLFIFVIGCIAGAAFTAAYFKEKEARQLEEEAEWCERVARGSYRDKIEEDIEEVETAKKEEKVKFMDHHSRFYTRLNRPYKSVSEYATSIVENDSPPEDIGEPYVITFEQFNEEYDRYDKETMTYYAGDDTLADECEGIVDDVNDLVGDSLSRFGENSEDPDVVYVRNDSLEIDYEIVRSPGLYSEVVLGHRKET